MKKVLVTFVLALTGVSLAQGNPQPQATTPSGQAAQPSGSPQNQKVIKDPAEYNAYITALNTQDPAQRAAAMEAFIKQYPQSVVLSDALDQAMAAYQQANNQPQVEATAKRILQQNPNNIRALAIVVALDRQAVTAGTGKADTLKEMCTNAQTGIQQLPSWQKPEGMNDADFQKLSNQMSDIFQGASGFCSLQAKDYAAARTAYQKAVSIDPTNLQDVYQLSVANLEMNPMDKKGFWYCGKAISLAQRLNNPQAVQGMTAYCKSKYKRYHGGEDGWDQIAAAAATQAAPGPEVDAIAPAPTPAELACKAVQENDPSQLSFADWEYILQFRDQGAPGWAQCNKDAADKVWAAIQAKQKDEKGDPAKLKINVKVVSASADTVDAALTDDNQQANKADLHIVLAKPATRPPAAGANIDIVGNITDYTPSPFMFTMTGAELPSAAKPPVRKTVHKKS